MLCTLTSIIVTADAIVIVAVVVVAAHNPDPK